MLLNLFFVGVRVAQFIFCEGSCCSIYFLWGFMLLNLFFLGVHVAQLIFCGRSCCSIYFCGDLCCSIFTYISVL